MAGTEATSRSYRFGAFELDLNRGVLEEAGQVVAVRAKTFALLSHFAANPNRVITKDEVTRAVWNRAIVTDDSISQIVRDIRRVLGDASEGLLRTVPKRGFIFAEGVRSLEAGGATTGGGPSHEERALVRHHRGGRAAVAVLPFRLAGEHATRDAAAMRDGLLRDLTRDLSRLRLFFIVAAHSVPAIDAIEADAVQTGLHLAVDYVARGSLAVVASRVVVDVELIETATGRVIFAERFDRPTRETPAAGAEISGDVVRALAREMDLAERNRSVRATNLDSWTAYYRGHWHMHRLTAAGNLAAASLFAEAIELDPTFSRPYAGLSFTHWLKACVAGPRRPGEEARRALLLAQQALAADPLDPAAYCAYGRALWLNGAQEEGAEAMRRAAGLGPGQAFRRYASGLIDSLSGEMANGVEAADLSPFDPFIGPMMATRSVRLAPLRRGADAAEQAETDPRPVDGQLHHRPVEAFGYAGHARRAQRVGAERSGTGGDQFLTAMHFRMREEEASRVLAASCSLD